MADSSVVVTHWPSDRVPSTSDLIRKLNEEGLSGDEWSNGPGDVYGVHDHSYNKVIYVVSGSITFTLPDLGRDVVIVRGDRLDLPRGTQHGAVVGPHGVECLEAHY